MLAQFSDKENIPPQEFSNFDRLDKKTYFDLKKSNEIFKATKFFLESP